MTLILNLILEGEGDKNFKLCLENQGRVAHAKSSDPATPPKFETCTCPMGHFFSKKCPSRGKNLEKIL